MSKRILTLDVGASTIKLAEFQISKDHQLTLLNYGTRSIGLDPQDEANRMVYTGSAVDELFEELGLKPGPVLLSLSGQHVFSRYVKLPPVSGEKISQIVEYEAKQNIPHLDEVVWDRQILPGSEGDMDVLLAAVKQEVVETLAESVRGSGLVTELVDISIAALYNVYRHSYPDSEGCTMIMDMGAKTTNVIFAEDDRVWSRSFPVSGHTITQNIANDFDITFGEAEALKEQVSMVALGGAYEPLEDPQADQVSKCIRSSMTRLHAEIVRSVNTYRSQQNGQAPHRILLTGGSCVMMYLDVFLQEKLNIDVEFFNPLQSIQISSAVDEDRLASDWHLLSEVVGLGLRKAGPTAIQLNLLPPSIVRESLFRKKQGLLAGSSFLVVAILALVFVHTFKDAANQQMIRDQLQSQVDELNRWSRQMEEIQQEIEKVEIDLDALQRLADERGQWGTILDDIRVHLPQGVWITQLRPDETNPTSKLVLIGSFFKDRVYEDLSRPDNAPILQLLDDLKSSDSFAPETQFTLSVTDLYSGGDADMRRSIATFRIEIHLNEALSL